MPNSPLMLCKAPTCNVSEKVSDPPLYLYLKSDDRSISARYSIFPWRFMVYLSFDISSTAAREALRFLVLTCCFSTLIPPTPTSV